MRMNAQNSADPPPDPIGQFNLRDRFLLLKMQEESKTTTRTEKDRKPLEARMPLYEDHLRRDWVDYREACNLYTGVIKLG